MGLNLSKDLAQDGGKTKARGWVRRDRTISELKGQSLSLLTKRTHRDKEDKDKEPEVCKKKVAKVDTMTTVVASFQPCQH